MEARERIVEFYKWCPFCKYFEKKEYEDPCFDCLSIPVRENSTKPEFFAEEEN